MGVPNIAAIRQILDLAFANRNEVSHPLLRCIEVADELAKSCELRRVLLKPAS